MKIIIKFNYKKIVKIKNKKSKLKIINAKRIKETIYHAYQEKRIGSS